MPRNRPKRIATALTGTYRTPRGFECEVDVDDMSLGGCRVDDMRGGLQLGEYVQISIGEAGPFVAEVAWRQSTRVGLQFNRPLPKHILKELTGVDPAAPAEPAQEPVAEPDPEAPAIPTAYVAQDPVPAPSQSTVSQTGSVRRFI